MIARAPLALHHGLIGLVDGETAWSQVATRAVEIAGTAIIATGSSGALARIPVGLARRRSSCDALIAAVCSSLGRSILLGLEFLVAAGVITMVPVEPTLRSLAVLAGVVLSRTVLGFSPEVEIKGRPPRQNRSGAPDPAPLPSG